MALKLPSTSASGCSAKVRAGDLSALLKLSDNEVFSTLSRDAGQLRIAANLYSTIDTISPITRNPETFGKISVTHAISDLHAVGVLPTDACASFGLDSLSIRNGDGEHIIRSVRKTLENFHIRLCKAHSFISDEVHVTLAVTGKCQKSLRTMRAGSEYSIVLTKELGAATVCHHGWLLNRGDMVMASEKTMIQDHATILKNIREHGFSGTTDISGFGLLGHLAILSQNEGCEVKIDASSIRFFEGLNDIVTRYPVNCSAQRNQEDFDGLCRWETHISDHEMKKLFASETSGPLACIVAAEARRSFIRILHSKGFRRASCIGSIKISGNPQVTIA